MAGRLLPGTTLRVRRGRRDDVAALCAVLGAPPARWPRGLRRVVGEHLRGDVYVAEDGTGTVVGVVAVSYARSLFRGMAAVLDGVRTRAPAGPETLAGLVAFAEDRARRRGCRRLTAWLEPDDAALRATLAARGYDAGEAFTRELDA